MPVNPKSFDVLVIGAGAGGLFTAARLVRAGYSTLVVERLDQVGGRASSHDIDGFTVNNGAIVIEAGGITEETFDEVGAKFDVREPNPPILYRIGSKDVDVTGGGWGFLLSKLTRQGAKLVSGLGEARKDHGLPEDEMSTADWVAKYTKNESVHGIFRNMCGSVFAVGSEELPARVFLTYFTRKSAFKRFGFCPEGTIGIWRSLANAITAGGGRIWLGVEATGLTVSDGAVSGATVRRADGSQVDITAQCTISDTGPAATLKLAGEDSVPAEYAQRVRRGDRPCAMIAINFASRERLIDAPGMLSFANTRRMCYVANFTDTCPEMAPEGWHLYVGTSVPRPSVGDLDEEFETEQLRADLRDQIPGFDDVRILSTVVTRDQWPPQRAVAGYDLPRETPLPNLYNVGDGVKEYANGGTTACAETAKLLVNEIIQRYPATAS